MENLKIGIGEWLGWCADCQETIAFSSLVHEEFSISASVDKGMSCRITFLEFKSEGYERTGLHPWTINSVVVSDATEFS